MGGWFQQAFVYLCAALIVVPIASRLGLGSVLGYLVGGVLIGPHALSLVGQDPQQVMHFAEFGVVMMLFLIGLELEPARLWRMRGPIFGLGGAQVGLTALVVAGVAVALGLPWQQGLALGLILSMSSTAIALQTLAEKGLMRTEGGQRAFSVLLFQDIAVIPMLAAFPLLATVAPAHGEDHGGAALTAHLPPWAQGLAVLGAIALVIGAGRFLVRPVMRAVARTGMREMFTATALAIIVGTTLLMAAVGLSAALGAFLAGVVLASSEYRHELESDVEPFKGLLLGLFFLAVGASIDFPLIAADPLRILGLVVGVMALKAAVLVGLARAAGARGESAVITAAALCNVGEFAFVLLSFAGQSGVLGPEVVAPMVAVTALSMALAPLAFPLVERVILPRLLSRRPAADRASDVEDHAHPVIIAGYGRFGQIAGRFLQTNGVAATVLDVDGDEVELLRRFGNRVYYGDASRVDLLRAAGASSARLLIVAVDAHDKAMEIVHSARKHFPHLAILVRAHGRAEAYELIEAGVEGVYRETFDTALRVGVDALRMLGADGHQATRLARSFRRYDERMVEEMAAHRLDQERLVATARQRIAELEALLRTERQGPVLPEDHGWDSEPLREHFQRQRPAGEG